ncbi:hypothetical protein [Desertibacillus haloalkaliphilus]|uniref:hypothetical protein n=1 Tax=Desertibacillus haloalkaliphilus TaxID=1328930 RepID=UPI001C271315|nr:hypothetical protein [Desertibacillus haloalkaliphilus]MBU8907162.1 hypothetical protein [Desertibacillus haloalkaliphilus]
MNTNIILTVMLIIVLIILIMKIQQLVTIQRALYKQQLRNEEKQEALIDILHQQESVEQNALQEELRSHLMLKALKVRHAVDKQTVSIHARLIENAPRSSGLTDKQLASTFSPQQLQAIEAYWQAFNDYLHAYWLTKNGKVKTVFRGHDRSKESEIGKMMHASHELLRKLDPLLDQLSNENQ